MNLRYGVAAFGLAAVMAAALWGSAGLPPLAAWLVGVNCITLITYGFDKWLAGRRLWRVPERTLLLLALSGGSLGAYAGMHLFHHKTVKASFQAVFRWVVAAQVLLLGAAAYWFWGR